MAKIAIIGPGAIGATVATHLARAGQAITLCARTSVERLLIASPDGPIEAAPAVVTDPAQAQPAEWVLICTKAYDVAGAAAWLPGLTRPETRVAVLQNGVEHRARFAGHVAPDRLVPVIVDIPAERLAPRSFGSAQDRHVRQHRHGTLIARDDVVGRAFVALFAATPLQASVATDWVTVAWRKLCINSCGIALTLIDRPFGASREPGVADAIRVLAAECAAVGRAEGANLPADLADEIVAYYQAQAAALLNSMHADLRAGRPLELDARNRVVVRLGEKHGVPTPGHRMMIGLVEGLTT